jgi:hypothetical protein
MLYFVELMWSSFQLQIVTISVFSILVYFSTFITTGTSWKAIKRYECNFRNRNMHLILYAAQLYAGGDQLAYWS